ncbi:hypothetical protein CPLU01_13606 [Colletotrichum plurivorum]|uniref:Uncharacterized protein n=1 Tax=Colletotrichum plurivorum TaxID=2175906 RepID=A0A8H6JQL6_9PEZI|nr:hypothetical protein CPLU01_13606 [Colletotrichum plurivorum]
MSPAFSNKPEQSRRHSGGTQPDNILGIFNIGPSANTTNVRTAGSPSPTEEEYPDAVSLPEGSRRIAPADDKGWETVCSKGNEKAKQRWDDSQSSNSEDRKSSTASFPCSQHPTTQNNSYSDKPQEKTVYDVRGNAQVGFYQTRYNNRLSHPLVGCIKKSLRKIHGEYRFFCIIGCDKDNTLFRGPPFYTHKKKGPPAGKEDDYIETYDGDLALDPPPESLAFEDGDGRPVQLPERSWLRWPKYVLLKKDEFRDLRPGETMFMTLESQFTVNAKIKSFNG